MLKTLLYCSVFFVIYLYGSDSLFAQSGVLYQSKDGDYRIELDENEITTKKPVPELNQEELEMQVVSWREKLSGESFTYSNTPLGFIFRSEDFFLLMPQKGTEPLLKSEP